jgi:hypothetical protein
MLWLIPAALVVGVAALLGLPVECHLVAKQPVEQQPERLPENLVPKNFVSLSNSAE